MFTIDELHACSKESWFIDGYKQLARVLLLSRLGLPISTQITSLSVSQLSRYSEAVLASASIWVDLPTPRARKLCETAADVEAAIAILTTNPFNIRSSLLRAAILYELAGLPATSASTIKSEYGSIMQKSFFSRERNSVWGQIGLEMESISSGQTNPTADEHLVFFALDEILEGFGRSLQHTHLELHPAGIRANLSLRSFLTTFSTSVNCSIQAALLRAIETRRQNSALELISRTQLTRGVLSKLSIPSELWPVQKLAVEGGLLDPNNRSFGIAAPTGTGKTALTKVLLADFFQKFPEKHALYISPSRALTGQIASDLHESLHRVGISVLALGASLNLTKDASHQAENANVIVFTPEKADLLLRVQPEVIANAGLVIVDEAHHIEQGTRGILLEFYLWRLRSLLPPETRIVQLSAVTPNIDQLVGWLANEEQSAYAKLDRRSGRLRLGQFERVTDGSGVVQFEDGAPCQIFAHGECSSDVEESLAQLALKLSVSGVVLVLTTSPARAELLAEAIAKARAIAEANAPEVAERVDARIERELYPTCILRELYKKRVAFHHARLPPRVRLAIEQAISTRQIDIICATTTLAEGVNFPFSTVIVESLIGKGFELSPRSLWNIAGRAGRFGVDSEGHCILFRPSIWKNKLKEYQLENYLTSNLDGIPPVRSALGKALVDLKHAVDKDQINLSDLSSISLDLKIDGKATDAAKRIRGLLNVMRVGYAHALVSKVTTVKETECPEFKNEVLLASRQMNSATRAFAVKVAQQQRNVIVQAAKENDRLLQIAARIGWSLESQTALYDWIQSCEDWQLERFGDMVRGGYIMDFDKLSFLIGPISKRMIEFEGDALGGMTTYVATNWLRGFPLTAIRDFNEHTKKMGYSDLVKMIYARVQYLLPWALFGVHELVQLEAEERSLHVGNGISELSALASEGVPNYDALNLVMQLDIERVDASRLARVYFPNRNKFDIFTWLKSRPWPVIMNAVQSPDNRRLDPDLKAIWENLKQV
jgi:hypothetical protein